MLVPRLPDCVMIVPSSTYESSVVSRLTEHCSYSLMIGAMYRDDKTGDRAEPWPTPTSACLGSEQKLFQRYDVTLPTRYEAKNLVTSDGNPSLDMVAKRKP